jgi:hypothetical protein
LAASARPAALRTSPAASSRPSARDVVDDPLARPADFALHAEADALDERAFI